MSKNMISVPRELLERLVRAGCWPADCEEMRALLDQPNTCAKDGGQCGLGGYCEPCHSIEPVVETAAGVWHEGSPPSPWDSEWFLAKMRQGHFVVLRSLPEEYSYDFTTADGTYVMRDSIIRWAQLSGSSYILPAQTPVVLPGRLSTSMGNYSESQHSSGWNACLDEFKRLNPNIEAD